MLEKYVPIDYRTWILGDKAREGINIKKLNLLNQEELGIANASISYQDARNDPGHWEFSTRSALVLLNYLPGKREIAVPTTICHDIGWYGNDPNAWKALAEKHKDNLQALETEDKRRPHQNRGILLTGRILEQTGYFDKYPLENWLEIADGIGDHDTKKLPATENGRILRMSDFLWRATYPVVEIYIPDEDVTKTKKRIEETCLYEPNSPLGDMGFEIAKLELANTIYFKFGEEQARQTLGDEYSQELEQIKAFYNN